MTCGQDYKAHFIRGDEEQSIYQLYNIAKDKIMNQKVSPFMRKGEMLMVFTSIATGRPKFKHLRQASQ